MSEKEAKLAAARKRAEALKAKKAKKSETDKAEDQEVTHHTQASSTDVNEDPESSDPVDGANHDGSDLQQEIDRLQGLLEESTLQQETLKKDLQEAQRINRESDKELRARITDLESSLTRREEHVQSLELDMSNAKKENEALVAANKDVESKHEQVRKELTTLKDQPSGQSELDEFKLSLEKAVKERDAATDASNQIKVDLEAAQAKAKDLEDELANMQTNQSTSGAGENRERELQIKTDTLVAENKSLIDQLSELRKHLISVQDEKFALVESIERLQKELKDMQANKALKKSSSEVPRARISKDFERSVSMQEVSLHEETLAEKRNPTEPPVELQSNIEIDLTSWYDKHAGEVIEV